MQRGVDQARGIINGIAAFAPQKIISSSATRCLDTVEPLSRATGLPVKATATISQDAYELGTSEVAAIVAKRLRKKKTTVLCSHGPVLPQIIDSVASQTGSPRDAALRDASSLGTGDFTVIHISREHPHAGIVAIETHSPA